LLLGDTLVLAAALVNGITVTQCAETAPSVIDYIQIELATHDCVIAEGVWAETYADAPAQRAQFHNCAEYDALYPDEPPREELQLCAARPEHGAKLDAALRPVVARAAAAVKPGRFEGWVDKVSEWRIEGWALDNDHKELPVLLEILVGDRVIGTVLACDERSDLVKAGIGNGRRAFSFQPPMRLPASCWPDLWLRRACDGAALGFNGSAWQAPMVAMAAE
jgi:hypothetical protein